MEELVSKKNRKQRRYEAKLARSRKTLTNNGSSYWVKRIIGEMIQSPKVQEAVISGKLDKYLEG